MRNWTYIFFAMAGAGVTALKGFLYAHALSEIEFASIGYYLLALGFGGLVVGGGVILRAHTELPLIPISQRSYFVSQGRSVGFLFWLAVGLPAILIGSSFFDLSLLLLIFIQVFIFFLFTFDVVVRKSDGDFTGYARAVFFRNFLLMFSGLIVAYFTGSAFFSILAEVLCGFLSCLFIINNWISSFKLPGGDYFRRSLGLMPISILGGVGQYADRLCASFFLPVAAFSIYSYLSLLMLGALAVQQIVNTKVITLLPLKCQASPRAAYLYLLRVSAVVFFVVLILMSLLAYLIFFSVFSSGWLNVDPVVVFLFILGVSFKSADFFSGYLVVMRKNKYLVFIQVLSGLSYLALASFSFYFSYGFGLFVFFMVIAMMAFTLVLMFFSWRVSLV